LSKSGISEFFFLKNLAMWWWKLLSISGDFRNFLAACWNLLSESGDFRNFWRDVETFCVNLAFSDSFCPNLATLSQNFPKKSAV